MKTKYMYIAGWAALLVALASCSDMNDTQKEYLDRGEKVYAAKVDSAVARAGNLRQQIDIYYSSPRIAGGRIYYNRKQDSVDFTMPTDGRRQFSVMINGLEETEYNYTIYTFDRDGNRSLPKEISGKVYGRIYADYLLRRAVDKITNWKEFVIHWKSSLEAEGTNLTYVDKQGNKKFRYVPTSEDETVIEDAKEGSEFSYTTVYRPEPTAIDTLESLPLTGTFPTELEVGLQVYDLPTNTKDAYDWKPEYACDRNLGTGYHTGGESPMPHQLAFAMDKGYRLQSFRIYQRIDSPNPYQSANPRKFQLLGTNDTPATDGSDNGWTVIGEYEITKPSGTGSDITEEDYEQARNGHEFGVNSDKTYRYLRIRVTETWGGNNYIHFMELQCFGNPQE